LNFDKKDILELKLTGKEQNPRNISSKHALELLKAYEEALVEIVCQEQFEIDLTKLRLSLVGVEESSTRFLLLPSLKQPLFSAAIFLSTSVNSGNLSRLPAKSIKNLQEIQRYSKTNNCSIHFIKQGKEELTTITPNTSIEFPSTKFIHGETVIYGKILRVGGVEPKAFIQLEDQKSIAIKITEDLAKDLAKKLYDVVGLKGQAKWLIDDYSIQEFNLLDFIEYEREPYAKTFEELGDLVGIYWKDIDDVEKALE
jgi:hypothetical protein